MKRLSTTQAANIADEVYDIRGFGTSIPFKESDSQLGLQDDFKMAKGEGFKGKSGALLLKSKTEFGYIAEGQGRRQGEVLIAIRGTHKNFFDIATDLNQGVQIGPSGWPVHAGFNETFKTFKNELTDYFSGKNPTHVHCVGHSLGGALATLTADFITEKKIASASLYTFGSPRTGNLEFSRQLTQKIKAENIYRVYHRSDPVSMIPLFPFFHAPALSTDITLPWRGCFISSSAHGMDNYISSVRGTSWGGLRNYSYAMDNGNNIKNWLESAASQHMFMHSSELLWLLAKALNWLIKKISGAVVGTAFTIGMTIVDQLAWILTQGSLASIEVSGYVTSLMARILQFLSKGTHTAEKITVSFVRWVLSMLFTTISNFASLSLNQARKR